MSETEKTGTKTGQDSPSQGKPGDTGKQSGGDPKK